MFYVSFLVYNTGVHLIKENGLHKYKLCLSGYQQGKYYLGMSIRV